MVYNTQNQWVFGLCSSYGIPSEDGNRSSFRNVVFSSYLEFRRMEKKSRNPVIIIVIHKLLILLETIMNA
jgi:hypothetical protein